MFGTILFEILFPIVVCIGIDILCLQKQNLKYLKNCVSSHCVELKRRKRDTFKIHFGWTQCYVKYPSIKGCPFDLRESLRFKGRTRLNDTIGLVCVQLCCQVITQVFTQILTQVLTCSNLHTCATPYPRTRDRLSGNPPPHTRYDTKVIRKNTKLE